MRFCVLAMIIASLAGGPASATTESLDEDELNALLSVKIRAVRHLALNPTLIRAVRAQNSEALDAEKIATRDREWQETKEITDFKRALQENVSGRFLRGHVTRNASFNEAFLTDKRGANVAAYPATSDYFQGDEDKWAKSYNNGAGELFVGPVERDESTNVYAVQISAPVLDQGATIGVLVVGVTLDYVQTQRSAK